MKIIWLLTAASASAISAPAFAQRPDYSAPYVDQGAATGSDIERQIQRLDDQINASDRQGRISPQDADMLVRELRDIETQLLDIRSRTFHASQNWNTPRNPQDDWRSDRAQGRVDDGANDNTPNRDQRDEDPGHY